MMINQSALREYVDRMHVEAPVAIAAREQRQTPAVILKRMSTTALKARAKALGVTYSLDGKDRQMLYVIISSREMTETQANQPIKCLSVVWLNQLCKVISAGPFAISQGHAHIVKLARMAEASELASATRKEKKIAKQNKHGGSLTDDEVNMIRRLHDENPKMSGQKIADLEWLGGRITGNMAWEIYKRRSYKFVVEYTDSTYRRED